MLQNAPSFDFSVLAPKERIVFFDIETTGLSAERAQLYLIGAVHYADGAWRLVQYFAEYREDEAELLEAFFALLAQKKKTQSGQIFLLSYNGNGFDLPFLKKCAEQYRIYNGFSRVLSFDLYQKVKAVKKPLGLPDCKLKTVERFLGIDREDRYSGGELIEVYEEYLRLGAHAGERTAAGQKEKKLNLRSAARTEENSASGKESPRREKLKELLLLHNAEDIENLPAVCWIMGYERLFAGAFLWERFELRDVPHGDRAAEHVLKLTFSLELPLPGELALERGPFFLTVSGSDKKQLELYVQLYEGELKYFFADYKNYYYLPEEDCAVHKSVGEFVSRSARRQATARTCYQRKKGLFLPEPESSFAPVFYEAYRDKTAYAAFDEKRFAQTAAEDWKQYACSVLRLFLQ